MACCWDSAINLLGWSLVGNGRRGKNEIGELDSSCRGAYTLLLQQPYFNLFNTTCLALCQVLYIHYSMRKFMVKEIAAQIDELICLDHVAQIEVEFELRSDLSPSMYFSSTHHTLVSGDHFPIGNEKLLEDFKLPCNMTRFAFWKDLSGSNTDNELRVMPHQETNQEVTTRVQVKKKKKERESLSQWFSQLAVHWNHMGSCKKYIILRNSVLIGLGCGLSTSICKPSQDDCICSQS